MTRVYDPDYNLENPDDIDGLFEIAGRYDPPPGYAFAETLAALRNGSIPARPGAPVPASRFSWLRFSLNGLAAALIVGVILAAALGLVSGLSATGPNPVQSFAVTGTATDSVPNENFASRPTPLPASPLASGAEINSPPPTLASPLFTPTSGEWENQSTGAIAAAKAKPARKAGIPLRFQSGNDLIYVQRSPEVHILTR